MTYYEFVEYVEQLKEMPKNDSIIEKLNNMAIDIQGDRYYRFVNKISYLVKSRFDIVYKKLKSKMLNLTVDDFTIEFNEYNREIEFLLSIAKISKLKKENSNALCNSINESNKKVINELKNYYKGNEKIIFIINDIMKEDKNEL